MKINKIEFTKPNNLFAGFEKIVKILIENRADVNLKDIDGNTALVIAVKEGILPLNSEFEHRKLNGLLSDRFSFQQGTKKSLKCYWKMVRILTL